MKTEQKHGAVDGDEARVEQVLGGLTLEEKAALTVGRDAWTTQPVERLGVPSVWVSDGPTGLRKVAHSGDMSLSNNVPATCFPTESALGASWDVDLVREVGRAIADEAQAAAVQVLLAPGVNLKRSPLCGRNFEYFAEDPILSGELAAAYVGGLQERGVGGCLKHLVANESETDRMITSSEVDERTLRELYLRPFEIAVRKADPWTLMAAYNRLNGVYCTENRRLLHDIVAQEWGYRGIIVSDWVAVNDRVAGVAAGLHLQMPGAPTAPAVLAAVREGRLDEAQLDEIVRALLRFVFRADANRRPDTTVDFDAHHRLARRVAAESVVLLKNDGALLPLADTAAGQIALIGAFAREPRYQGAGSSQVTPVRAVETIHDELLALLGADGLHGYAPGYEADGTTNPTLLAEAQELARGAQTAVVVVGLPGSYEEEGADRTHIDLPPGHNALVEAILAVQPRTVVVLINGSAVALPWLAGVPALLEGWLGGQAGGGAIADALLGRVNPSGKLAETFPARLEDTPAFLSFPDDGNGLVPFTEGLFTGYRWYDARRIEPLFPFGHGLSYTSFEYSDLTLDRSTVGAGETLAVTLRVRNSGTRAGREVVQLYVREQQPRLPRPQQELRAFAKLDLQPGEQQEVRFELEPRDFALYDPAFAAWTVGGGEFELRVSASSRDIRLRAGVTVAPQDTHRLVLSRMSSLRDWLLNPVGYAAVRPILDAMLRQVGGDEAATGAEDGPIHGFIGGLPISKLVMFGVLSEDDLAALIAKANEEAA